MSMEDDTAAPAPAEPVAAVRAKRARKALEAAEADLKQAEIDAAPSDDSQPVMSKMHGRAEALYEGEPVRMRITSWGGGHVSTGKLFGFERYRAGAVITMPEQNARSLFNKRWAEPIDPKQAERFIKMNESEDRVSQRRGARARFVMENGVAANETWSTLDDGS